MELLFAKNVVSFHHKEESTGILKSHDFDLKCAVEEAF